MCTISPKLRTFTTSTLPLPILPSPSTVQLMDLPNDLLYTILDVLPVSDAINFTSTCKRIRSLRSSFLKDNIVIHRTSRFNNKENLSASPSPERLLPATPFKVINISPIAPTKRRHLTRSTDSYCSTPSTSQLGETMSTSQLGESLMYPQVSPMSSLLVNGTPKRCVELQSTPNVNRRLSSSKKRLRRL